MINFKYKKNNLPLYYQIYEFYKLQIQENKISLGTALPTERDLSIQFKVSRSTIRQALKKLEEDGLIYRIHGNGTFVSSTTIKQELTSFYSFYEEAKKMGKIPSSKVISHEIINIDNHKELVEIFKLPSNSEIIHIRRLRLIDNEPIMFEDTYLPLYRFANFDVHLLDNEPMYSIFKDKYNVIFERASESFSSLTVNDSTIINYLNYNKNAACLLIKRIAYEKNKIIEYTVSYARGDKYEYKITLNNVI